MGNSHRAWWARACIALVSLLIVATVMHMQSDLYVRLDNVARDALTRLALKDVPEDRIVIVDIDEHTLRNVGQWPWRRAKLADLIETLLATYGARVVGLDIVLPEPADDAGDRRLASIAQHGPLVLAQILDFAQRPVPILQGQLLQPEGSSAGQNARLAYGFIGNHEGLRDARCVGNIGYQPDADGVLRHSVPMAKFDNKTYAWFAGAVLQCAGLSPPAPPLHGPSWRVPYQRPWSSYVVVPAIDVLQQRVDPDLLGGRIVLVGSSAIGLGDRVATPLASMISGVMVHAASLSALLDRPYPDGPSPGLRSALTWLWTVITIVVAVLTMAKLRAWASVCLLLGLALTWVGLVWLGLRWQLDLSPTAPLWGYLALLLLGVPFEWFLSQRTANRLMSTLSHYVSKPVLDEIVKRGLSHSLEPKLTQVTVLIADMEGYTRTTASLSLENAATLTKEFLESLTNPVLALGGTLDKYSGDGLVAFWGAPLPVADHADRAVSAALEILDAVTALNERRRAQGQIEVRVRIGIESGMALVGDLGTRFRSTYTAVGDCINFASRLETAVKDVPTQLLIGACTNSLLTRHTTKAMGILSVRGTDTQLETFTVVR